MAKIRPWPKVELVVSLELSEAEARALDALAGYGADALIKVFYEKLGRAYMEPCEAGLRTLLISVRETMPRLLAKADKAKTAFVDA